MTALDTTLRAPAAAPSFGYGLSALWATVSAWNSARHTRRALSQLSDHELQDIGLTRYDIDRVSRML